MITAWVRQSRQQKLSHADKCGTSGLVTSSDIRPLAGALSGTWTWRRWVLLKLTMPSTVIRSFKYDADRRTLFIVFQSGRRYTYKDVPAETYQAMKSSSSKGEFFNAHIRNHFSFVRASEPD